MSIPGDNPIVDSADDALGRSAPAGAFARHLLLLDRSQGAVAGVLGAWGSGKTSFVNLARGTLEDAGAAVLDFNPWMFSGAEQLVESFFIELSAQLKLRPGLVEVGEDLEDYGEVFTGLASLPLVGPWIERGRMANRLLSKLLQRRKEGSGGRRERLKNRLRQLQRPIVVVLDDIDRLSTAEIRDVFKLVRLTASLPNVIYVLAFDRERVESALSESGIPGRDYLEKILQVSLDLPAIPEAILRRQVLEAIDEALAGIEERGPFDEERWPDVFVEVIQPLIRNMRDVRRYAASSRGTVERLHGQVALVDVLALEAIRTFLPDVFAMLHSTIDGLTAVSNISVARGREDPALQQAVERLLQTGGERSTTVEALIRHLFPAGSRHLPQGVHYGGDFQGQWLRAKQVAHPDVLKLYLEGVANESLEAFHLAEGAWVLLDDQGRLDVYLRSIDRDRVQDVIASLESYESQFQPEHVVPATVVLLNMLPDIPERPVGMLGFETRMVVARVTYRLLRSLGNPGAVADAVRCILPELTTLSARRELVTDVGYVEGAGHKLVSHEAAAEFEGMFRMAVRQASPEDLAREPELLRVLWQARTPDGVDEPPLEISEAPMVTAALVRSARTETRSQTAGSRVVRRSPRLAWSSLTNVLGGDDQARQRLAALASSDVEFDPDLLQLVQRYLDGWRPDEGFDDDEEDTAGP